VSISVLPGARSKLRFDEIRRDYDTQPPGFVVLGELRGDFPYFETVDAAVVASDGKVYEGSAKTNAAGRFSIPIGPLVPPGKANVMIYYNGTKMAAAHLGPVWFTIP
jgi:hypothetical protein